MTAEISGLFRSMLPHRLNLSQSGALLAIVVVLNCLTGCNYNAQQRNITGRQAFETGQYNSAINEFQKALQANPRNPDAYYNLGATYYQMGKQLQNPQYIAQAEQLFRQSIALDDKHVDAHRYLAALLIESGQEKFAFDLLNTWRSRYPNSADPSIELARLYKEFGDSRQATDYLADAIRVDPRNVRALKAMGFIREQQGELQLALENYYRVLAIDNRQTDVAQAVNRVQTQIAQQPPSYQYGSPTIPR
jgi:cytochrome c-type biogenesis protein CcmH/NrfG